MSARANPDRVHPLLFVGAGITSADALGQQTPAEVVRKIDAYVKTVSNAPTKGGWDSRRAKKWIDAARKNRLDKGIAEGEKL